MSNDLAVQQEKSHRDIVKEMYFKGSSDAEFEAFMMLCKKTHLDPIAKQIYAMKAGGRITTIVSIDGLRLVAERSGKYAPGREPSYTYDKNGKLLSATSYVKKLTGDGTWHEVASTAHLAEFEKKSSPIWKDMPHVMLAKCAESQALRRAFPNDLSGLYSKEEMEQAEVEVIKDTKTLPIKVMPTAPEPQRTHVAGHTFHDLLDAVSLTDVVSETELRGFMDAMKAKHSSTDEHIVLSAFASDEQMDRFHKSLMKFIAESAPAPEAA
jgi:phage recombination protein Bet